MGGEFKKYFGVPDLDFSGLSKVFTDKECDDAMLRIDKKISREERLAFIERMEAHPEALTAWDMDISFDEYARRVRAGEYD